MFFYLVLPNLPLPCTLTFTSKAYNRIRRTTDIISHSSSVDVNASRLSNLSNVTGYFSACAGAHSPAVELDNAIRFRLWSGPF